MMKHVLVVVAATPYRVEGTKEMHIF